MMPKIKKILYATDLSPNSTYALRYAMDGAISHDASIVILHVLEQLSPATLSMLVYLDKERRQQLYQGHTLLAIDQIKERLKHLCEKEFRDYPQYEEKIRSIEVCEGFPAEKILSTAKDLDCDTIIMGTHSQGVIANTFLGSTAKRVLRRTRIPVLIIPLPNPDKPELTNEN